MKITSFLVFAVLGLSSQLSQALSCELTAAGAVSYSAISIKGCEEGYSFCVTAASLAGEQIVDEQKIISCSRDGIACAAEGHHFDSGYLISRDGQIYAFEIRSKGNALLARCE